MSCFSSIPIARRRSTAATSDRSRVPMSSAERFHYGLGEAVRSAMDGDGVAPVFSRRIGGAIAELLRHNPMAILHRRSGVPLSVAITVDWFGHPRRERGL